MKILNSLSIHIAVASLLLVGSSSVQADVSKKTLESISIADTVETPIGTLEFFDGVPSDATISKVYDNLDRSRAMGVYLDNMGAVQLMRYLMGWLTQGRMHQIRLLYLNN